MGAKKVNPSKNFFADFDLDSDEEKDEPKEPTPSKQNENLPSRFSRLSYDDYAPAKTNNKTQSNGSSKSKNSDFFNNDDDEDERPSNSRGRNQNNNNNNNRNQKEEATDYARSKFANAKSISSDQYFGRDKQETNNYEKEARLAKFSGAQSISSADYFERDETVSMSDMSASDVARKIAWNAKSDFGQISTVVVEGGKKLSQMASSLMSELQDRYS